VRASAPDRIVAISNGPVEVEVLPGAGARLHRIRAFGHDLLRTPADATTHLAEPFAWGGYVMAPWCNRIKAEPTTIGDRTIQLASNIADGSAIHGQVYDRPWGVVGPGRFLIRGGGGDGWPWRYEVGLAVAVEGSTLRIEQTVTNLDDSAMPAGIGLHPWFAEPLEVRVPARSVYRSNLASSGAAEPVAGPCDLRRLGPMAEGLDATWTDLDDEPVELHWPATGIRAELRARATVTSVDGTSAELRPCVVAANLGMGAVAIEPQTHAPQGIRRLLAGEPDAMLLLDPGGTLYLSIELAVRR
jgi:aldose 1-epimerase